MREEEKVCVIFAFYGSILLFLLLQVSKNNVRDFNDSKRRERGRKRQNKGRLECSKSKEAMRKGGKKKETEVKESREWCPSENKND